MIHARELESWPSSGSQAKEAHGSQRTVSDASTPRVGVGTLDYRRCHGRDGSFAGFAYLSKVDRDKKALTVYEGLVYGFSLSADPKAEVLPDPTQTEVPEPASLPLVSIG